MISHRSFTRLLAVALLFAAAGCGAAIWGYLNRPEAFFTAWLTGFYYWVSIPLGALALLMIHDLAGGKWEVIARPPLEAATATMPLFILAFLPIIAGMNPLYAWSRPELFGEVANRWYLNAGFFGGRAAVYFLIWNFFALLQLWRPPGRGTARPSLQWVSAIGLILLGYSVTFASIDWLMSIERDWFSTVYGMMVGAGQFVLSLSVVLLAVTTAGAPRGISRDAFGRHLANLATILLAVDIFWAYTSYSQWLIIWEENLRTEIPWYVDRMRHGWEALLYTIAGTHFFIPFFLLVWTPTKRSPIVVGSVCGLLVIAHMLQISWLVLPHFHGSGFTWLHPLVALGIGGVWLCFFLWRLRYGRFWPERLAAPVEGTIHG
jgi:hypothetical protein